ncbi:MAG: sigma 54-dependent Fis family transcriptional regulator [Clostridia bacterium]|nr:sigma 54-dependent Fis family transcriptional regulator [Deltaproteobacteria bacterium]
MESDAKPGPAPRPRQTTIVTDRTQIQLQRCKLVQMTGAAKSREFELAGRQVVAGSGESVDLKITDNTVSKEHFAVVRDEQSYLLKDLGSTNGTFLDNARIREVYLRPGGIIKAGDIFFRFEPVYERIELVPSDRAEFTGLLGVSFRMREIFTVLEKVAATEATILLQGETGTGKGAVARAIHSASNRKDAKFVVFDCGAIAPTLIESELFGHERGAFTGAVQLRKGALEEAQSGTLFIDELAELPLELQPKLLRALEERTFMRVGSNKAAKVDSRIIAASQRDLWTEVSAGRFREDLYFRLAVVTIPLPPLRDRTEDIPMLVDGFMADIPHSKVRSFDDIPVDMQRKLLSHDWPGNIRELRNTIERMALMDGADPFMRRSHRTVEQPGSAEAVSGVGSYGRPGGLPTSPMSTSQQVQGGNLVANYDRPFKDAKDALVSAFEREYLSRLLSRTGNNIARAAREASIDRKYLYTLLAKHGLQGNDDA